MAHDGVTDDPDGRAMRQVPSLGLLWGQSAWISECGVLRNRYYDVSRDQWTWGEVRTPVIDRAGRAGHRLHGTFRTLEQAVALAWVPRRAPMRRMQRVGYRDEGNRVLVAHNLRWMDESAGSDDDDDDVELEGGDDEAVAIDDEGDGAWRTIAFKTAIVPCRTNWQISRDGRVRIRDAVYRGAYAIGPSRFLPISNVGLVPVDDLSRLLFEGERRREPTPPRVKRVMRMLRRREGEGTSIPTIAAALAVRESTAWSYVYMALQRMSTETAQRHTLRLLRDPIVRDVLAKLAEESPVVYACRLRDLAMMITRLLAGNATWMCNPHRYSELCALRSLLQRTYERDVVVV